MLPCVLVVIVVAVLACLVWLCQRIWAEGRVSAADFARTFPGRCMVCSYHQYGIDYGFVDPRSQPEPHHCIEVRRG